MGEMGMDLLFTPNQLDLSPVIIRPPKEKETRRDRWVGRREVRDETFRRK